MFFAARDETEKSAAIVIINFIKTDLFIKLSVKILLNADPVYLSNYVF
jgi:hypothetical protein